MRARRGLCGAARQRRVVKEPQFMNSEFTKQLWCLDALLSRGPGERPGRSRAHSGPPPAHRRFPLLKINYDRRTIMRVRSGYPGRAPAPIGELGRTVLIHAAPPTRPVRLTAATGPVRGRSPRQATAPPCRYNFSLLGDGVRRRPTLPVPRCDTGHPAQRAQRRADQAPAGGHSRHSYFRRPRPTLATRERQSPTQVTLSLSTPL